MASTEKEMELWVSAIQYGKMRDFIDIPGQVT